MLGRGTHVELHCASQRAAGRGDGAVDENGSTRLCRVRRQLFRDSRRGRGHGQRLRGGAGGAQRVAGSWGKAGNHLVAACGAWSGQGVGVCRALDGHCVLCGAARASHLRIGKQ